VVGHGRIAMKVGALRSPSHVSIAIIGRLLRRSPNRGWEPWLVAPLLPHTMQRSSQLREAQRRTSSSGNGPLFPLWQCGYCVRLSRVLSLRLRRSLVQRDSSSARSFPLDAVGAFWAPFMRRCRDRRQRLSEKPGQVYSTHRVTGCPTCVDPDGYPWARLAPGSDTQLGLDWPAPIHCPLYAQNIRRGDCGHPPGN